MSTKKGFLAKPTDWDAWISFVRTRATNTRIWDLVNPNLTEKHPPLDEPTEPEYEVPDNDFEFDSVTYDAYKAQKDIYKMKVRKIRATGEGVW